MYKTSFCLSLFVFILMLPWTVVDAAGLGKLTLNSALGQPLNAEIDLVAPSNDELQTLKASVASRETYVQAGISYESVLSSITASVESRANGNRYIKLASPQAINDPFLMVLMELSWASGRILREYTVLLDPIDAGSQSVAAVDIGRNAALIESRLEPETPPAAGNMQRTIQRNKSPGNTAGSGKNAYGPVNRGDTLSSIARRVMPAGVNLNQMLVALHRANSDAFVANNMNLLKVGAVLKIPEFNEITAIDTAAANKEIKVQVSDWRRYQGRLASMSRGAPASRTISQSDQGLITANLEKKTAASTGGPKEVLKLSSGAQISEIGDAAADAGLVDRLRMMEEDTIARNLALREANERVVMLERSVQNLKHLLELKDSMLAQAQLNAQSQTKSGDQHSSIINPVMPEAEPPGESQPDSIAEIVDEPQSIQATPVPLASPAPESKPAAMNPPVMTEEAEDASLTDLLFDYIEYVGALSILALLLVWLRLRRRRANPEEAGEDDSRRDDFSSAIRSRMAAMSAASVAAAYAGDASASGADDGLNDGAASAESDEFDQDVDHYDEHETYDEDTDTVVEAVSPVDDYTFEEPDLSANLEEDAEQARSSDADSRSDVAMTDRFEASGELPSDPAEFAMIGEDTVGHVDAGNDLSIDFDHVEPVVDHENDRENTVAAESIDFELADTAIDLTSDTENDNKLPSADDSISLADDIAVEASGNELLTFESVALDEVGQPPEQSEKAPEFDFSDIDLNLEEQIRSETVMESAEQSVHSEQWQEVETKLDLAKAYFEMDDKEGAKEMLEEVIQEGDDNQRQAAKKMLKEL